MSTASRNETRFSTPSDREVEITRVFDAPRRLVYAAHTEPEHVRQWMLGPEGWTMPVRDRFAPGRFMALRVAARATGMKEGAVQSYDRLDDYLVAIG